MTTDTSEKGLESIIVRDLLAAGWLAGGSKNYDREYCVDMEHLSAFVRATQPKLAEAFDLANDSPTRRQFLRFSVTRQLRYSRRWWCSVSDASQKRRGTPTLLRSVANRIGLYYIGTCMSIGFQLAFSADSSVAQS